MTKISDTKFQAIKSAAAAKAERLSFPEVQALADKLGISHFTVQEKLAIVERTKPVPPVTVPVVAIERETDKAICARHAIGYCSSVGRQVKIWWPKSQVTLSDDQGALAVPGWLAKAKLADFAAAGVTPWFE